MKNKLTAILLALALVLSLCACAGSGASVSGDSAESPSVSASTLSSAKASITLNGSSASVSGSGASADGAVVTISSAGSYEISGTLDDGQIIVDVDKDDAVELILNGVTIFCSSSAPINALHGLITVTLASGTVNTLSDGSSYTLDDESKNEPSATLFSKDDLTITGSGCLDITANYNHAVCAKDDLVVEGGEILLSAANDGLHGGDSITITGGSVTISQSVEGIEAPSILISGGSVDVTSSDDGLNASSDDASVTPDLTITGGTVSVCARGDGIDSNGTIHIQGGEVYVSGPTDNANGPIDTGTSFVVDGGVLVAAGSSGMAITPDSSSAQCSVMFYTDTLTGPVELRDADGATVLSFTPLTSYSSVLISSPDLVDGETYTLYSDGAECASVTLSGSVTTYGSGGMQMGGGHGGMGGGQFPSGEKPEGFDFPSDGEMPDNFQRPTDGEMPTDMPADFSSGSAQTDGGVAA